MPCTESEPASGDHARPEPKPKEAEAEENRLLDEARERYSNLPARKEVPGAGEMYFPEVLPSPHIGRAEPEAEGPEGPLIQDKDARRALV